MPPSHPHPFALYNPALLPADVLLAEYTARLPLLETLLGIVRGNAPGHPPQHALLIGARGMGKTTTLWAVAHRIARDAKLAAQWQPVVFDEESRRVGDLADFWLESIRQWEFATGDTAPDRAGRLLTENPPDIEDRAFQDFTGLVHRSGKRVLLLIDNLNDLFSSIRDAAPLHRLRATLMQDSGIMLIGGATAYFDHVTSIDQPFFDFFRIFELKPLTLEEMQDCLKTLARTRGDHDVEKVITERQGSIHALHILTGGNPRLIRTFYRLLREGLHTDIRADLERLLDEFTPYFKSIIDPLPGQQQRIFDAVALAWNPVEVATLATATRLPSNQVSAQLRALVKSGLIREAAGQPKKKTYLLTDRFSNIHYLMRHGRAARNRLDWFVATIRVLFPDQTNELIARLATDSAGHGLPGQQDARDVLHSALTRSETAASRRDLLHCTVREAWSGAAMEKLDEWFDLERAREDFPEIDILAFCSQMPASMRTQLGYKPDEAKWWHDLAYFLEERQAWPLAEAAYCKAIELNPKDAAVSNNFGNLLKNHLKQPAAAEAAFRNAIECDPRTSQPWNGLGTLLQNHLKRPVEAEAAYRKAIELDPKNTGPLNNLGNLYSDDLQRPAEAVILYYKAIKVDPKNAIPWNNLGNLLQVHFHQPIQAEAAYRRAIELDPQYADPWNGLGSLFQEHLQQPAEAEAAYRRAIELNPRDAYPWQNLGILLLDHLHHPAKAESAYRRAIELDPTYAYPRAGLAASLLQQSGNLVEARASASKALLLKPDYGFARHMLLQLSSDHPSDWKEVLPSIAEWCVQNPKADEVFQFTVDGLVRYARLTTPARALEILASLPDAAPFESVKDALVACGEPEHLHRLAPERQSVAMELMRRLKAPIT